MSPNLTTQTYGMAGVQQPRASARAVPRLRSAEAQASVGRMTPPLAAVLSPQQIAPRPHSTPPPQVLINAATLATKFSAQLVKGDELGTIRGAVADALKAHHDGEQSSISIVNLEISRLKSKLAFDTTGETDKELRRLRSLEATELSLIRERHWRERDTICSTRLAPVAMKVSERCAGLVAGKADALEAVEQDIAATFDLQFNGSGMLANLRQVQRDYETMASQAKRGLCDLREPLLTALLLAQAESPPA
jgi:hypothetical protein